MPAAGVAVAGKRSGRTASHEEQNAQFQAALGAEDWAAFERLQQTVSGPDDDPELERMDFDASFAQLRTAAAAHPLPPLLVALTRGVPASTEVLPEARSALPPDFPWDAFHTVWQALQAELAALVPGGRQVIATESGHYVQLQQPDLVVEAIQQVVGAVRDPRTRDVPGTAVPRSAEHVRETCETGSGNLFQP